VNELKVVKNISCFVLSNRKVVCNFPKNKTWASRNCLSHGYSGSERTGMAPVVFFNKIDQGCSYFFSMRATFTMKKSKWSTYYKNESIYLLTNILRIIFTMYVDAPWILTWAHIAQPSTINCVHFFVITWLYSDDLHQQFPSSFIDNISTRTFSSKLQLVKQIKLLDSDKWPTEIQLNLAMKKFQARQNVWSKRHHLPPTRSFTTSATCRWVPRQILTDATEKATGDPIPAQLSAREVPAQWTLAAPSAWTCNFKLIVPHVATRPSTHAMEFNRLYQKLAAQPPKRRRYEGKNGRGKTRHCLVFSISWFW